MAVRKMNRNKKSPNGKAYLAEGRALKNKRIKIARHQKDHPNDRQEIGTVPSYKTKKKEEYLFGAIPKGFQAARKSNAHGQSKQVAKNK